MRYIWQGQTNQRVIGVVEKARFLPESEFEHWVIAFLEEVVHEPETSRGIHPHVTILHSSSNFCATQLKKLPLLAHATVRRIARPKFHRPQLSNRQRGTEHLRHPFSLSYTHPPSLFNYKPNPNLEPKHKQTM